MRRTDDKDFFFGCVVIVALAWVFCGGCVTAVDHADEYSYQPEDLFGAWTLTLKEAEGASYSVMTFTQQGCVYDELVRVDGNGNVESRTVYRGSWEPTDRTIDLREPGEPEVLDRFELRGDVLTLDGVAYRRGRLAPPTLVGTWRSEDSGATMTLAPGGVFYEASSAEADYFEPGTGLATILRGFWDVNAGRLEVRLGSFSSQAIASVDAYQLRLDPGGTYDLVPDDSITGR